MIVMMASGKTKNNLTKDERKLVHKLLGNTNKKLAYGIAELLLASTGETEEWNSIIRPGVVCFLEDQVKGQFESVAINMVKGTIAWKQHIDGHIKSDRRRRGIFVFETGFRKFCLNFVDNEEADRFAIVVYSQFPELQNFDGKIRYTVTKTGKVVRNEEIDKTPTLTRKSNFFQELFQKENNAKEKKEVVNGRPLSGKRISSLQSSSKESDQLKERNIRKILHAANLKKDVLKDPQKANDIYNFYDANKGELEATLESESMSDSESEHSSFDSTHSKSHSDCNDATVPLPPSDLSKHSSFSSSSEGSTTSSGSESSSEEHLPLVLDSGPPLVYSSSNHSSPDSLQRFQHSPTPRNTDQKSPSNITSSSSTSEHSSSNHSSLEDLPLIPTRFSKSKINDQNISINRRTSAPPLPPKVAILRGSPTIPKKSSSLKYTKDAVSNDYSNDLPVLQNESREDFGSQSAKSGYISSFPCPPNTIEYEVTKSLIKKTEKAGIPKNRFNSSTPSNTTPSLRNSKQNWKQSTNVSNNHIDALPAQLLHGVQNIHEIKPLKPVVPNTHSELLNRLPPEIRKTSNRQLLQSAVSSDKQCSFQASRGEDEHHFKRNLETPIVLNTHPDSSPLSNMDDVQILPCCDSEKSTKSSTNDNTNELHESNHNKFQRHSNEKVVESPKKPNCLSVRTIEKNDYQKRRSFPKPLSPLQGREKYINQKNKSATLPGRPSINLSSYKPALQPKKSSISTQPASIVPPSENLLIFPSPSVKSNSLPGPPPPPPLTTKPVPPLSCETREIDTGNISHERPSSLMEQIQRRSSILRKVDKSKTLDFGSNTYPMSNDNSMVSILMGAMNKIRSKKRDSGLYDPINETYRPWENAYSKKGEI